MCKRRQQDDSARGDVLYHRVLELEKERVYFDARIINYVVPIRSISILNCFPNCLKIKLQIILHYHFMTFDENKMKIIFHYGGHISGENVLRLPLYYMLTHKQLAVIVYASALSQITFFNSAIFICHYFILKLHLVYIQ